jgi:hypothetical protein
MDYYLKLAPSATRSCLGVYQQLVANVKRYHDEVTRRNEHAITYIIITYISGYPGGLLAVATPETSHHFNLLL